MWLVKGTIEVSSLGPSLSGNGFPPCCWAQGPPDVLNAHPPSIVTQRVRVIILSGRKFRERPSHVPQLLSMAWGSVGLVLWRGRLHDWQLGSGHSAPGMLGQVMGWRALCSHWSRQCIRERLGPAVGAVGRELGKGLPDAFRRSNRQDLVIDQM